MALKKVRIRPIGERAKTVKVDTAKMTVKEILAEAGFTYNSDMTVIGNGDLLKGSHKMGKHEELIITPSVGGGQ